jgi:hypothetical protein
MEKLKLSNALVLGKRNKKVRELEPILAEHFLEVRVISKLTHSAGLNPPMHFDLVVITDSFDGNPSRDFGVNLRRLFPEAKVLGLFDTINPEIETNMRNVGLIFLGSYDHFIKNCPDILRSAFESRERQQNRGSLSPRETMNGDSCYEGQ